MKKKVDDKNLQNEKSPNQSNLNQNGSCDRGTPTENFRKAINHNDQHGEWMRNDINTKTASKETNDIRLDKISFFLFPIIFALFNLIYWLCYVC